MKERTHPHLRGAVFIGEWIMLLDIKKYLHYLDGLDLSPAQKEEVIRTVWGFMESSADQVFGQHPVQQCRESDSHKTLQSPAQRIDSEQPSIPHHFKTSASDAQKVSEDYDRS